MRASQLVCAAVLLLAWVTRAHADLNSRTLLVYVPNDSNTPVFRVWDGSAWGSASAMRDMGGYGNWVMLRNCPTRNETACAILDQNNDVNVLFHNGSIWSSVTELTTNADEADDRNFDIAYEQNSGDALIVCYDLGDNNFRYRTYNGSTLSSSMTLTQWQMGGNDYVALYPKPNSDQIVLITLGQVNWYSEVISANVWNGSSWSGWTTIESSATSNDDECFGFAFESLSGDGLLVYGEAGQNQPRYRTWNGSWWSSEGQLPSTGGAPWWVRLVNAPAGDQILFAGLDSTNDINVNVWNGSSWGSNLQVETQAPAHDRRVFDLAYEFNSGNALLVYVESGQNRLRYRTWNGSSWSSESSGTDLGELGRTVQLRTGLAANEIFIAAFDNGSDLELMRWNGASMSSKTQVEDWMEGLASTEAFMISIPAGAGMLFTDVSAATGFNVQTTNNADNGSGLHWGDLDNDGDLDAVITGNQYSRLLLNNLFGGSFAVSNFGGGSVYRQGAFLDIDNDGDLDFFGIPSSDDQRLYLNNGSATFTDAGSIGLTGPANNEGLAAADVNGDGWCGVVMFSGNANWLGHHQAAQTPGLIGSNAASYGLNDVGSVGDGDYCSAGDLNNDGYLDFFYHYDGGKLFLSDGDGTYTLNNHGISISTGTATKVGSAWADYDNDGDLDLFVPRHAAGQAGYLWRNDLDWSTTPPTGSFTNVAIAAGVTDTSGQRSCCWGDYDNDRDLDLYVVTRGGAANVLYQNQGAPNWNFAAVNVGTAVPGDGHDAVFVDYDNDGDLDLAVTQQGAANALLRNGTNDANYLKVRLLGHGAGGTNRAAIGTRVEIWNAAGTTLLARRDVGCARGFGGTEPLWLHFGGLNNSRTYTVKVYWTGHPATETHLSTVIPALASTLIGGTTIPQMLTVQEPSSIKIIHWREKPNRNNN